MNRRFAFAPVSFTFVASLAAVLVACSGATSNDSLPDNAPTGANEPSATDPNTETADSDVKSGKKRACSSVGGTCVGLNPSACPSGVFADAAKVSCGGGLGTACCVSCPVLSPPSPASCPGGHFVPRKGANGCIGGYDCVKASCPELTPPPPNFCPGGTTKPITNPTTGCLVGFECEKAPTNPCVAAGGTCVGLSPGGCPSGKFGDATTHSCNSGLGIACCLP